jgi:hypothetical protein
MNRIVTILVILVSFLTFKNIFSQNYEYEGIDLTLFEQQPGFKRTNDEEGKKVFYKENIGYFSMVVIIEGEGICFNMPAHSSSGMKWQRIYNEFVRMFNRKEDLNTDYIASYLKQYKDASIDDLIISCLSGTSELKRCWREGNKAFFLGCDEKDGISLLCVSFVEQE